MKKYLYMFVLSLAVFSACDSTEEIYKELDAKETGLVYDLEYTLTEDDYSTVGQQFANFGSADAASEFIPAILGEKYPQFGVGSSAIVHYNLYAPIRIKNKASYTLASEDYTAIGEKYGNLNSQSDITKATNYKHPSPQANDVVTITYEYFASGQTTTQTSKVVYYEGEWRISYVPTADDYKFMGQSFSNFDSKTTGRERIAVLFDRLFPFGQVGELRTAVFTYTYVPTGQPRVYEDFLVAYQFDGTNWIAFEDVVPMTLKLGNDGASWIPDNTIKYALSTGDYAAIGNASATSNPAGSTSILKYSNFDLSLWSEAQIIDAIGNQLLQVYPNSEEGQKYLVSYKTYAGGVGTVEIHLILQDGVYVKVQ